MIIITKVRRVLGEEDSGIPAHDLSNDYKGNSLFNLFAYNAFSLCMDHYFRIFKCLKCLKIIVYHKQSVSKPNNILIFPMMTGLISSVYFSILFFSFGGCPRWLMLYLSLMNNPVLAASIFPGLGDTAVNKPWEFLTLRKWQSNLAFSLP